MNLHASFFACATVCALGLATSCADNKDFTAFVDPLIGTGGHGHTHPGAMVPHGMIQPGPDTRIHGWDASSGYYYEDDSINGFAHTRLSGTGCADFGDFLVMPIVGEPVTAYCGEKEQAQHTPFASAFKHENEVAQPGYYSVQLERYGVKAELASTCRAAIHRWTFPQTDKAGMVLDLDYCIQEQTTKEMEVEVSGDTIRAYHRDQWWQYDQRLFFEAVANKPIVSHKVVRDTVMIGENKDKPQPRCKLLVDFGSTTEGEQIMLKASISSLDREGAHKNLMAEMPEWDFDGTVKAAKKLWNDCLKKIEIETTDSVQRTIFYTAMYHTNFSPNVFQDVDGRYLGMDLKAHQGDVNDPHYTIFSLWDTHRALHPLMSIIDPAQNEAYIRSLIQKGEDGGLVPKWDCAANYTGCMNGYHYVALLADMYTKGYRNYDVDLAYKHAIRSAEYDTLGITEACPSWLYPYVMPAARKYRAELGYVPSDKENESVAKALELCYNDWCVAQLAKDRGDKAKEEQFTKWAKLYTNYFDPEVGFMRGKMADGTWRSPFSPSHSNHRQDDYCEGNAYQWSWFVPHDPEGLIALYGGRDKCIAKLEGLFSASSEMEGEDVSADISGLIGQYAHGNEPSHATIFLFNALGMPWRTQELVDYVLYNLYSAKPDGLSGNEDCGQMSAWYILNSMGFYQPCPGRPEYTISRPIFDRVTIHQPNGKDFVITAKGNSPKAKYVKTMTLNGTALDRPYFTHEQLVQGGELVLEMSETRK